MFFNSKFARIPSALMVLGVLAVGCGDDDDDKVTSKPDGGTLLDAALGDAGGGTDAGGGGTSPGALSDFSGTLVPILAVDTSAPIVTPHVVEILNQATGKSFSPPITGTTTAGTGTITLKAPADPVMVWIKGVGTDTYDTVIANASRASGDKLLRISSSGTANAANGSGGFVSNPDRAAVTGSVYWSQSGARKGTVGCAKIFVDGKTTNDTASDQLYNAASGLPTTYDKQQQTLKSGRFYIANMTVGPHKLKVSLDNGTSFIGPEVSFVVPFARKDSASTTKAVLVQVGIDVEGAANPTPSTCVDPT